MECILYNWYVKLFFFHVSFHNWYAFIFRIALHFRRYSSYLYLMMCCLFSLFKTVLLAWWIVKCDSLVYKPYSGTEMMCKKYNLLNSFTDVYVSTQFMYLQLSAHLSLSHWLWHFGNLLVCSFLLCTFRMNSPLHIGLEHSWCFPELWYLQK
jgi:hypothetical protein